MGWGDGVDCEGKVKLKLKLPQGKVTDTLGKRNPLYETESNVLSVTF